LRVGQRLEASGSGSWLLVLGSSPIRAKLELGEELTTKNQQLNQSDVLPERKRQKYAKARCLRVPFQTREAMSFPLITLIAAAAWYSFTAFSSAVETLHLL
jgi:hypothetical protein